MLNTAARPDYEDDIDLLRYGRFLSSYWHVLLLCSVVGIGAGLLIAARQPSLFQATATIAVTTPSGTGVMALTAVTSRALLENLTLVSETLKEIQLDVSPQQFIQDSLAIQAVPSTNLLKLTVSLPDPTKARLAATAIGEKGVALSRRIDAQGAATARDAYKVQVEEAGRRLDATEKRLLAFKSGAQIELRDTDVDARMLRRGELGNLAIELETEKARLATIEKEMRPAPVSEARPFIDPLNAMLQFEAAATRARISSLEQEWKRTLGATRDPVALRDLQELYRLRIELSRLEAEYEVSKDVYSTLATHYEEAIGRVVAITPQLMVIDPPVQPDRPQPRRTLQFGLLGGLLGFAAGAIAAVLLNRRRTLGSV